MDCLSQVYQQVNQPHLASFFATSSKLGDFVLVYEFQVPKTRMVPSLLLACL